MHLIAVAGLVTCTEGEHIQELLWGLLYIMFAVGTMDRLIYLYNLRKLKNVPCKFYAMWHVVGVMCP
jgi:hypothetical protein